MFFFYGEHINISLSVLNAIFEYKSNLWNNDWKCVRGMKATGCGRLKKKSEQYTWLEKIDVDYIICTAFFNWSITRSSVTVPPGRWRSEGEMKKVKKHAIGSSVGVSQWRLPKLSKWTLANVVIIYYLSPCFIAKASSLLAVLDLIWLLLRISDTVEKSP